MLKNFWIYCSLIGGTMLSQHSLHASNNAITVAWEGPPRTLDPRYAIDANSQYLMDLIHCSLIGFDSDGGIEAQLAKKWEWTSEKSIKIYLKKGIKYSNNQIVTSSDVKKVYEFFLTKDLPKPTPLAGAPSNFLSIY